MYGDGAVDVKLPSDITFRHLRFDVEHLDGWKALLSPDEAARADGFRGPKRREEFILGRAAARLLLAERLGIDPSSVPLRVAGSGAIDVLDSELHLSISHSGDRAVAAAAPRLIGVDVETIAPRRADLERFMLHPQEHDLLESIPLETDRARILCWTLKEATLKAMRTGLRTSPKRLRLFVDVAAEAARAVTDDGAEWDLQFEEWDGFYVAVAYAED